MNESDEEDKGILIPLTYIYNSGKIEDDEDSLED